VTFSRGGLIPERGPAGSWREVSEDELPSSLSATFLHFAMPNSQCFHCGEIRLANSPVLRGILIPNLVRSGGMLAGSWREVAESWRGVGGPSSADRNPKKFAKSKGIGEILNLP
jgi:hypothetical protein